MAANPPKSLHIILIQQMAQSRKSCPLRGQIPKNIFHLILHCNTVTKIWKDIKPLLLQLHPIQVSNAEKAFGIVINRPNNQEGNRPSKHLGNHVRNWLTYLMRRSIAKVERKAHYSNLNITNKIRKQVQHTFVKELDKKLFTLYNDGKMEVFHQFFAYKNVLCKKTGEATYKISKLFAHLSTRYWHTHTRTHIYTHIHKHTHT